MLMLFFSNTTVLLVLLWLGISLPMKANAQESSLGRSYDVIIASEKFQGDDEYFTKITSTSNFLFTTHQSPFNSLFFILDSIMFLAPELFNSDPIVLILGSSPCATAISVNFPTVPRPRPEAVLFPWSQPPLDIERLAFTNETFMMMQSRDPNQLQISLKIIAEGESWASIRRFLQQAHEFFILQ